MGRNKGKFRKGLCERKDEIPCDGTECETCENHHSSNCPALKIAQRISKMERRENYE
jgi:hypothetical protein